MWPAGSAPLAHARCGTHAEGRRVQRARGATTCFQKKHKQDTCNRHASFSKKQCNRASNMHTVYTVLSESPRSLDGISPASSPLQEGWRTRPRDKEEEGGHAHATSRWEATSTLSLYGSPTWPSPSMSMPCCGNKRSIHSRDRSNAGRNALHVRADS